MALEESMNRFVRYLVIPMLLLAAAGCRRDSASFVKSGNKFFDRAKYKEASLMYRNAIKKDPKNPEAYYRLGLTSIKLQDFMNSLAALRRAVDLQPTNTDAAVKLAELYLVAYNADPQKNKSALPEVRELSEALLKRDPNSFDGLRFAGNIAVANQDLPLALAKFEKANQIKPNQPELTPMLVQVLVASNRFDDAEKIAKQMLAGQKNFAPMYDQLVMMYLGRNRLPEAEQILRQKVDNNPKQEAYYLQLAGFYLGTQRKQQMEDTVQRLLSNPKDFPTAHLAIGRFFYRFRDYDRARREYDTGLKEDAKNKALYQKATVELLGAEKKYAEARVIINEILKDNPKDTQGIEMRSALQLQSGTPQDVLQAVNDLQALVTKSPDNPIYRFELGRALILRGLPDQARVHLEESVRLRPDLVVAKLMLGQILSAKGDHARALQMADDVIKIDPNNIQGHLSRSSALIGMGEQAKAKEELDRVLRVAPTSSDARFQLGLINYQTKNFKEADSIFRQLQESAPSDTRGLIGVVETEVAQANYAGAISQIEAELKKDPNRQDLRLALANIRVRAEQYDQAIHDFQELSAKNPKSADLLIRLGETYRFKGDLNAAITSFRKATTLDPTNPLPLVRSAMLLDGMGRRNEAKPLYEQILHLNPDEPVSLNNLAYIKAEEGADLDQALALAQRAKQKMPQDPNVADTLGWVYIKKNLSEDAIRVFRDLCAKEPKNSTFRYHLAMALVQKGDRPNAKKELDKAMQDSASKDEQGKIRELMGKLN